MRATHPAWGGRRDTFLGTANAEGRRIRSVTNNREMEAPQSLISVGTYASMIETFDRVDRRVGRVLPWNLGHSDESIVFAESDAGSHSSLYQITKIHSSPLVPRYEIK